jgi:Holliday junction resolvasome RuvABC endonuclease subunit
VELTDGEMTNFWYITSQAGSAAQSDQHGHRLVLPKTKERQVLSLARLAWLKDFMAEKVLKASQPDYVGIEDYAIRAEQGAHYLGEIGGIARLLCWSKGVKLRLHDPITVKMFTAHDGTCQKDSIERAVLKRWSVDFSPYNQPSPKPTKSNPKPNQNRTTSEDLADAYAIAKIVWTEILLRDGRVAMKELHPKEIQVFNRITKTYPISLLDREWIVDSNYASDTSVICSKCGSERCCLANSTLVDLRARVQELR